MSTDVRAHDHHSRCPQRGLLIPTVCRCVDHGWDPVAASKVKIPRRGKNGIYSNKTMTYAEFGKLEFWCPLCGSPVNVGSVDVTSWYDPKPMVRVGRYECTRRGCEHGPPVDGCDG